MIRTSALIASAALLYHSAAAFAQDTSCDSVLLYARRNIEVNLTSEQKEDFHYLAKCDERFKSGSLSIAYGAFSLGGNSASSQESCSTETTVAKAQSGTTIISNLAVGAAIEAWSQCQKLKSAKMAPDITISGGTFTASIKTKRVLRHRKLQSIFFQMTLSENSHIIVK